MSATQTNFYRAGGTLPHDAPSYVKRQADDKLYAGLSAGHFCYVLTSRQMGKSSLMAQTAARLRAEGTVVVMLDLAAVGQNLTAEQWYYGLLTKVGEQQPDLEDELDDFWLEHERLGPLQRWMRALREVVLEKRKGRVVIFIDEIDAVLSLRPAFSTDEFFAAIRELYNRRTQDAELARLTFCLLGVATPSDLILDPRTTPFNIGQRIELGDFTETEAAPLAAGLNRPPELGARLLHRILYWTGGHPYLTQRLCQAVAEDENIKSPADVDRLCEDLFLSPRARERDDNLLFVRKRLLPDEETDRAALLDLYAQIRAHKRRIKDDETNPLVSVLRLSGITRVLTGYHYVRNRIYYRVFDREWIAANMPDAEQRRQRAAFKRGVMRAAAYAAVVLIVMSGLSFYAFSQKRRADRNAIALKQALDLSEQQRALLIHQKEMEEQQAELKRQIEKAQRQERQTEEQRQLAEKQRILAEQSRQQAIKQQAIIAQQAELAQLQRNQAMKQTELARQQREQAEKERQASEQMAINFHMQAIHSEEEKIKTRRLLYAVHMSQAEQAWNDGNLERMRKLLHAYLPQADMAHASEVSDVTQTCRAPQAADATSAASDAADPRGFEWYYLCRLAHNTLSSRALDLPGTSYLTSFSSDGARLAVVSGEENAKSISVWNAQTGGLVSRINDSIFRLNNLNPTVYALALSPDGTKLVTGQQGAAVLFDARTGQVQRTYIHRDVIADEGPAQTPREREATTRDIVFRPLEIRAEDFSLQRSGPLVVGAVAFSPDGRLLALGGRNAYGARAGRLAVKLWDVTTEQEWATLSGHEGNITALAFAPDGKRLASAGADGTLKIWAVPASATTQVAVPIVTLKSVESVVSLLAFSPDGRILATGCADNAVRLWDMTTGQQLGLPFAGHTQAVTAIAFSPDGRKLATASADKLVRVWAVPAVQPQPTLPKQAPTKSAAAPSGWFRPAVYQPGVEPTPNVLPAQWLPAPPFAGVEVYPAPRPAKPLKPLTTLKGHKGAVLSLKFSADGQHIMTIGADEALKVWLAESESERRTFGYFPGIVNGLAFTPDGRTLAVGSGSGVAHNLTLWDTATGKERLALKADRVIYNVAFSPDGKLLAAAQPGAVSLWDIANGSEVAVLKHPTDVFSVAFAPRSQLLAASCKDGTVKLWDWQTRQEIKTLTGHSKPVEALAFSPDGTLLATASYDQKVRLWDVATGQERGAPLRSASAFRAVAFSPDGKLLVTGGGDNLVRLWNVANGQLLATFEGHTGSITYLAFAPDGKRIASASDDGSVRLWAVESEQEVAEFKGGGDNVWVVAFAPDGQTIAAGNQDGTVSLYDTTNHPDPQTKLTPPEPLSKFR